MLAAEKDPLVHLDVALELARLRERVEELEGKRSEDGRAPDGSWLAVLPPFEATERKTGKAHILSPPPAVYRAAEISCRLYIPKLPPVHWRRYKLLDVSIFYWILQGRGARYTRHKFLIADLEINPSHELITRISRDVNLGDKTPERFVKFPETAPFLATIRHRYDAAEGVAETEVRVNAERSYVLPLVLPRRHVLSVTEKGPFSRWIVSLGRRREWHAFTPIIGAKWLDTTIRLIP